MRSLRPAVLAALTAATPLAAQLPAGYVAVKTPGYDLYASSDAILAAARPQLDSARAQFSRYFEGPAPKLTVVVAATRDDLTRFNVDSLRRLTGDVLAWTITASQVTAGGVMEMRSGDRGAISLLGNLPAVIAPAEGRGTAVRFLPPGANIDLKPGDIIRAINGTPKADPEALNAAYNALATGSDVKLDVDRQGNHVVVAFAKPAGEQRAQVQNAPPGARSAGPSGASEPRILAHEAGHHLLGLWLIDRLGGRDAVSRVLRDRSIDTSVAHAGYGSPLLPDWIDEAGATLAESASEKADRQKYIVDNFGGVVPLAKFFTTEHPVVLGLRRMPEAQIRQMVEAQKGAGAAGQTAASGPVSMRVPRGLDGMDPGMFYAQSLSVAAYLAEVEGPKFLGQLAESLARGETMEVILTKTTRLPKTVAELHDAWVKWATR